MLGTQRITPYCLGRAFWLLLLCFLAVTIAKAEEPDWIGVQAAGDSADDQSGVFPAPEFKYAFRPKVTGDRSDGTMILDIKATCLMPEQLELCRVNYAGPGDDVPVNIPTPSTVSRSKQPDGTWVGRFTLEITPKDEALPAPVPLTVLIGKNDAAGGFKRRSYKVYLPIVPDKNDGIIVETSRLPVSVQAGWPSDFSVNVTNSFNAFKVIVKGYRIADANNEIIPVEDAKFQKEITLPPKASESRTIGNVRANWSSVFKKPEPSELKVTLIADVMYQGRIVRSDISLSANKPLTFSVTCNLLITFLASAIGVAIGILLKQRYDIDIMRSRKRPSFIGLYKTALIIDIVIFIVLISSQIEVTGFGNLQVITPYKVPSMLFLGIVIGMDPRKALERIMSYFRTRPVAPETPIAPPAAGGGQ